MNTEQRENRPMNPFNTAWIVMTWLFAATAVGGYFAGDHRIALVAVVVMAVLITGQTIGVDRAEFGNDPD